jgi:hypothetical protein
MRISRVPRIDTTILGAATLLALAIGNGNGSVTEFEFAKPPAAAQSAEQDYAGVWLSVDGTVRLSLETGGTYERSVAGRKQVTHGTYQVDGLTVHLRDDNGLRTTVTYFDEALEMAGHRLFRD